MKIHASASRAARIAGFVPLLTCGALLPAAAGPRYQNSTSPPNAPSNSGPVRLARFSYVSGNVNWRPDDQAEWSGAVNNLPVRQGAEISVGTGRHAELQFDDGSRLWMANGAVVTLRSLYSDSEGEYTEIVVRGGTVGMAPRSTRSVYQIDTPFVSVDAAGPSRFRVDTNYGVQVRERQGHITIQGSQGKATLSPGDYIDLRSDGARYDVQTAPSPDAFDDWSSALYLHESRYQQSPTRRYIPDNVAIVSDDLDDYGTWRTDHRYGKVWYPRERGAGWRPYHAGHWVWVSPFGWTWVASEPWGWAPYHYGSWTHESDGWAWVPGPRSQYWSPAAVDFCQDGGNVAWCPLAPSEMRYPPLLSIGYQGGDWAVSFSIGAAAVYYPTSYGYSVPRPWSSGYVNNTTYVNNVTNINTYYGGAMTNHNGFVGSRGYIPINSRSAPGASLARADAFGGRGIYQSLPSGGNSIFKSGHLIGAPAGNFRSIGGPPIARLTPIALAPTRMIQRNSPVSRAILARSVYQVPGAPGNRGAVQQARSLGAVTGTALGVGAVARLATHRAPNTTARTPLLKTSAGIATRKAIPSNTRALGPTKAIPVSSTERAAMRARTNLGRPAGVIPAVFHRTATASTAIRAKGTTAQAQQRPAGSRQETSAQHVASKPTTTGGQRTKTSAVTASNKTPQRTANQVSNPPRQARTSISPARSVQRNTSQPRRAASPVQHQQSPQRRQAPQNRQQTRRSVPQTRQTQQQAPQHRQAAPQNRQQAPRNQQQPRQNRQAPQRQQAPQNRQQVRRNAPQSRPGNQGNKGNQTQKRKE